MATTMTRTMAPRVTTWSHRRWAVVMREFAYRGVVRPAARLWFRPFTVSGLERLGDLAGPAIMVANHSSHLDAPSVLAALPPHLRRTTVVAAAQDYFYASRLKGSLVTLALNAFPLRRTGDTSRSLHVPRMLLRRGWNLLLFPEGTRSLDGDIGRFRRGVGTLATATGAPVVPVHIAGAGDCLPKGRRVPRRGALSVTFGAPVHYGPGADACVVADELRDRVQALASGATATTNEPSSDG